MSEEKTAEELFDDLIKLQVKIDEVLVNTKSMDDLNCFAGKLAAFYKTNLYLSYLFLTQGNAKDFHTLLRLLNEHMIEHFDFYKKHKKK